jgi:subtilisin family serine protease
VKRRLLWTLWSAVLVTATAIGISATTASATLDWQQRVDVSVLDAAATGPTEFFVYLNERAELSGAGALGTKEEKGRYVYDRLRAVAAHSQQSVIAALEAQGAQHRSFWVTNAILARGDLAAIEAVARLSEVQYVYGVGSGQLERPVSVDAPGGAESASLATTVFDSISLVKANEAWALGIRGQGAVVASADTGVRWTHEALKAKYRGWNGTAASHDYNWHDAIHTPNPYCPADSPEPCDDDAALGGGHGSHTVGTMVGTGPERAGEKNEIGMAPDAKWVACRNMHTGLGAIPTYLECMQWFIAPTRIDGTGPDPAKAPDVVNNSWGCVEVCPPPALQDTLQASRAAGIFYAVSAGNDGIGGPGPAAGCSTIYHPLARYRESFTVGATTWTTDSIAEFSSRGPVVLGNPPSEPLLRKPDITAPGVSIRSAQRANDSAYRNLSGTSMAGPHVAGLVALIISANPALAGDVDAIEDIIEQTAVPKPSDEGCGLDTPTQVPNNTYGWGRIDALAAVRLAAKPDLVVSGMTASNHKARAGEKVSISATITNDGTDAAPATTTEFVLDGTGVLGQVATAALAAGESTTVSVLLHTPGMKGEHSVRATADSLGQADELDESNNAGELTFSIKGNKVKNPSFEQTNPDGSGPANWSGSDSSAGSTSWSGDSASITGTGGNALLAGVPSWTSDPIDVSAGETLDLVVSVRAAGLSSAPAAGLAYIGALGQALDTVRLITAPKTTVGLETLERSVTIPAGVAQVRVVLTGFSPTDVATSGTVTFDDVGLFAG